MRRSFELIVCRFDLFAAQPTLRYKQKPYSSSIFLGILSILLISIFSVILYDRLNTRISNKQNFYDLINQLGLVMSQIGGVFQIFILLLIFVFGTYNQIKMQLTVASFFHPTKDRKKKDEQEVSFCCNLFSVIEEWINIFCCFQVSLTTMQKFCQNVQGACQIMDVKRIFKRVQYIEKVIQQNFDYNIMAIMSILKRKNCNELRNQRIFLSYYQKIMDLQQAATVQDAMMGKSQSFTYHPKKSLLPNQYQYPQIRKQIRQSLKTDLGLDQSICNFISQFPLLAQKAKQIKVNEQDEQFEQKLVEVFLKLTPTEKKQSIMQLPILILHRLRMKAIQLPNFEVPIQNNLDQGQNRHEKQILIRKQQSFIKRIKEGFRDFLSSFDLFSVQPLLRVDKKPYKSTALFGFVIFILFGVVFYLMNEQIRKNLSYNSSKFRPTQFKEVIHNQNEKQIKNFMMAIKFPTISQLYFNKKRGLLSQIRFSSKNSKQIQNIQIIPCAPYNWRMLGQNFYNQFYQYKLEDAYCLSSPANFSKIGQFNPFFQLQFGICLSSDCYNVKQALEYYQKVTKQFKHFPIWIYYLNPQIYVNESKPVTYGVKMMRLAIPSQMNAIFQQSFNEHKIILHQRIQKQSQNTQQIKIYRPDSDLKSQKVQKGYQKMLGRIQFRLTNNVIVYKRQISGLFQVISHFSGLFMFITIILKILLSNYNRFQYQLNVSQNYGKKVGSKQQQVRDVNNFLDVQKLLRRLNVLQRIIWSQVDQNLLIFMNIANLLSLSEVKKKQMILEYYDQIIHEQSICLEDILSKSKKYQIYMERQSNSESFLSSQLQNQSMFQTESIMQQVSKKQQIRLSFINHLKLNKQVSKTISQYPLIAQQSNNIKLKDEWNQIEEKMALSLMSLNKDKKSKIIMKIPLIILHRLRVKAEMLNKIARIYNQTEEIYQKYKQNSRNT